MSEHFEFFWDGPFSQWYPSKFVIGDIEYKNAEQYMMWCKDQLFGGTLEKQILATSNPREIKALGRLVPNFSKAMWESVARPLVFRGNMAKFTQNSDLLQILLDTQGSTLVEASPFDRIWGVGLAEEDPLAWDRATWQGTNWLGIEIENVRDALVLARKSIK